jgi:hypothetical protein
MGNKSTYKVLVQNLKERDHQQNYYCDMTAKSRNGGAGADVNC